MDVNSKKAFTIVEILVVVLVSTVVFAGIYSTFIVGNRAWVYYNNSVAVKKEARRALFGMINELREAENVRVIQGAEGSAVHFHRPSVGTVSYVWNTKGDDANKIIRHGPSGARTLAQHISTLSFQYSKNTIFINITASKQTALENVTQIALREKITLRSKMTLFE